MFTLHPSFLGRKVRRQAPTKMYKFAVLVTFLLFMQLNVFGVYGRDSGVGPARSFVGKRNSYLMGAASSNNIPTTQHPTNPRDILNQTGLSAWGLILIIIAAIVMAFGFYYGVICYPLLCKSEKNYPYVDVSSTVTVATSRSMQSMENFQIDAKDQKH